jgi:hypothetical protein
MAENGLKQDTTLLSKGDLEALARDGLRSIAVLMKHVSDNESIQNPGDWLSFISATNVSLTTLQKKSKLTTYILLSRQLDSIRGML